MSPLNYSPASTAGYKEPSTSDHRPLPEELHANGVKYSQLSIDMHRITIFHFSFRFYFI